MNKADLLDKMGRVRNDMDDLYFSMRQFGDGISSEVILAHAEELKGAVKMMETWMNGIEEDIDDE